MKFQPLTAADIDAFVAVKGITRCPTACANVRTTGRPTEADRAELAEVWQQQELAREGRKTRFRRMFS